MDVKTLKQKIQNLASSDIEWNKLFSEYNGKRNDYNGYDFKAEMIEMDDTPRDGPWFFSKFSCM